MKRVIAIGLSPNTKSDDFFVALYQLLSPWKYKKGFNIFRVEQWFKNYFNINYAVSFSSGRGALYAILKSLGIGKNDEVILQAFTCIVVPNSVIAVGAKPVYADTNQKLTINISDLEKKITDKTKALIIQHTFGIPSEMDEIIKLAQKHNLYIIEDAAHVIGGYYKNKKIGTLGDAAIFSLGRDKAFSSVFGGIAVTNNRELGEKLIKFQTQLEYPDKLWIAQQLFHPIAFFFLINFYDLKFVKLVIICLQKLHLLSFPLKQNEKKGQFYRSDIKKYPNALASLAVNQLKKIEEYNTRRKEIVTRYISISQELGLNIFLKNSYPLLRFPLFMDDAVEMRKYFRKKEKIFLGDWYANIIDPKGSDFDKIGFKPELFPNAKNYAEKIVNLPTYPTMTNEDIENVCSVLKQYVKGQRNQ